MPAVTAELSRRLFQVEVASLLELARGENPGRRWRGHGQGVRRPRSPARAVCSPQSSPDLARIAPRSRSFCSWWMRHACRPARLTISIPARSRRRRSRRCSHDRMRPVTRSHMVGHLPSCMLPEHARGGFITMGNAIGLPVGRPESRCKPTCLCGSPIAAILAAVSCPYCPARAGLPGKGRADPVDPRARDLLLPPSERGT